jgi:hypothetical protein
MDPGVVGAAPTAGVRAAAVGGHHGHQPVGKEREERVGVLGAQFPRHLRGRGDPRRYRPGSGRPGSGHQLLGVIHQLGGAAHRPQDPGIRAAPADVAGQLGRDPGVVGMRHGGQQRGRGYQPAGSAIPALHRAVLQPGLLNRVQDAVLGQALDGRDPFPGHLRGWCAARGHGPAADQDHAGAADAFAAAEFRAGAARLVPEHIQQGGLLVRRHLGCRTVNDDRDRHCCLPSLRR